MSLKSFLTRLIWICVLPLVLLSAYLAVDHVRSLHAQRDLAAANLARNFATSLDHLITARISALQVLAGSPLLDDPPRLSEFYREALAFKRSFNNDLLLADLSRRMLLITRLPYGAALPYLPTVQGHSAAEGVIATGRPAVGDTFVGPVSKERMISIAVPVERQGRTAFLLMSVMEIRLFQKRLDEIVVPAGYSLAVLDGKGDLVAARPRVRPGARPGAQEIAGRLVIKSTVSPWTVILTEAGESHHAILFAAAAAMAAAILGATLVSFLGGRLAGRRLARSVASLAQPALPLLPGPAISEIEAVRALLLASLSAREEAQATLRRSEERYRDLVQNANSAIIRWNRDGSITFFNEYAQRHFGYRLDQVLGRHVAMLIGQEPGAGDGPALVQEVLEHPERYVNFDNENVCSDGRRVWMTWTNRPIYDAQGQLREILAVGSDITLGKHAEQALRRNEQMLRLFIEYAPASLAMFDCDMRYLHASRRWLSDYGLGERELRGLSHYEVFPEIGAEWKEIHRRCLAGEVLRSECDRLERADGSLQTLRWEVRPCRDASGAVAGMLVFSEDISARKLAEERIERHIAVMRGINRIFQVALNDLPAEGLGARCLAVAGEITGSPFGLLGEIGPDGLFHDIAVSHPEWSAGTVGDPDSGRYAPDSFQPHGVYGQLLLAGKGFFTNNPARHPDSGALLPGHPPLDAFLGVPLCRDGVTYGLIAVGNRKGGYADCDLESLEALAPVVVEVFLRQKAELALKEREGRLKRAEEMAHLGYWRRDLAREQVTWSDEMYRIFGLQPEEAPPENRQDRITRFCHPDDLESCLQSCDPEGEHDGNSFEYRIVRPDGEERHVVSRGELLRDDSGAPVALFGTLLDATELRGKERELQEKNAELERFTYMISHDLKSPLVTLKTFLGYLELDLAGGDAARVEKDLEFMRGAAERMGRLLDELLEMSRVGRRSNEPVALSCPALVNQAVALVAGALSQRGVVVLAQLPALTLFGDQARLVEIWQNLVENACKFMGDQPEPRLELGARGSGRGTVFYVRDNGIGIESQYLEKVFGLFEKLDRNVEGTGLGLALVRRIVELNGGKIWAESQGCGLGTCISFTLPGAVRDDWEGTLS
jgi:PAS domain S-box-containing protein